MRLNLNNRDIVRTLNRTRQDSDTQDDAVYRLIYLGLEQVSRKWTMPIGNWKEALQQLAILYEDRLPLEAMAQS